MNPTISIKQLMKSSTSFVNIALVFCLCTVAIFSANAHTIERSSKTIFSVLLEPNVNVDTPKTIDLNKKIDLFWKRTREQLSLISVDANIEKLKEPLPYLKYAITVQSLNHVTIAGFLALPVQGEGGAKPWPLIVTVPGYSGNAQAVMLSECQRGYAILQVFPRGQGLSSKYYKINGDKLSTKLENPDGAYYQGAYADVIRFIDYMVTRTDIDSSRVALMATSQGGGIALAVAALDPRVKAVVAHVPFLCNIRLAATIPHSLVKTLLDKAENNNEAALKTLDFFDPFQLARRISGPVLMSAGGKDTTCPKATIESVYNRLPGKKGIEIYPLLPHTSCQAFYKLSWPWLDQNFKNNK